MIMHMLASVLPQNEGCATAAAGNAQFEVCCVPPRCHRTCLTAPVTKRTPNRAQGVRHQTTLADKNHSVTARGFWRASHSPISQLTAHTQRRSHGAAQGPGMPTLHGDGGRAARLPGHWQCHGGSACRRRADSGSAAFKLACPRRAPHPSLASTRNVQHHGRCALRTICNAKGHGDYDCQCHPRHGLVTTPSLFPSLPPGFPERRLRPTSRCTQAGGRRGIKSTMGSAGTV